MAIMILAISMVANIVLFILNRWLILAWEKDIEDKNEMCKIISNSWAEKYNRLVDEMRLTIYDDDMK